MTTEERAAAVITELTRQGELFVTRQESQVSEHPDTYWPFQVRVGVEAINSEMSNSYPIDSPSALNTMRMSIECGYHWPGDPES